MTKNTTPKEIDEQAKLVRFLDDRNILFSATAQSTYCSWNQINRNKKSGVRKGLPDMIICLPANQTMTGDTCLLFIEIKRKSGGSVSKEQKRWVKYINSVIGDVWACVCKGGDEAIAYVESQLLPKETEIVLDPNWIDSL